MEPLPVATRLHALPEGAALANASIEELFEAAGAFRRGHFLLKSGRHSDLYLEKFAVLQYPALAVEIGRRLAASVIDRDPTNHLMPADKLAAHEEVAEEAHDEDWQSGLPTTQQETIAAQRL